MAGAQQSQGKLLFPFGELGQHSARQFANQFQRPLTQGFGFDPSEKFQQRLDQAEGPLASFIRDVQGFTPTAISGAQDVGTRIAGQAPGLFNAVQAQVNQFLNQLPGFQSQVQGNIDTGQATIGEASDVTRNAIAGAQGRLDAAQGPGRSSALFQQIAQDLLGPLQQNAAARGFQNQGAAQAQEEDLLRQIAPQFALAQQQEIGDASAGLGALANTLAGQGATSAGLGLEGTNLLAQLAGLGPEAAGGLLNLLPSLAQLESLPFSLPLATAGDVLGLLQQGTNPQLSLAQLAAPIGSSQSKGVNVI